MASEAAWLKGKDGQRLPLGKNKTTLTVTGLLMEGGGPKGVSVFAIRLRRSHSSITRNHTN